jgi:O-acetyl-ADP-ribose deacetylase (regulator of RNase III)
MDQENGIAVTDAGNLKCSKIIHVVAPSDVQTWKDRIYNLLTTANNLKIKARAMPALGTGLFTSEMQYQTQNFNSDFRWVQPFSTKHGKGNDRDNSLLCNH